MDEAKLEEYINLCTPSFLIKMKTTNDKSYFFRAYKSEYNKDTTVLKFTIANIDRVEEGIEYYREIKLNTEFGDDFKSLKEVIIPEHKDMYKDIETDRMKVACSVKDKCSGDKLMPPTPPAPEVSVHRTIATKSVKKPGKDARDKAREALPKLMPPQSITPAQVARQTTEELEEEGDKFGDVKGDNDVHTGGRKKKKKRRKKSSRSKKRRNKRKNRTKKN